MHWTVRYLQYGAATHVGLANRSSRWHENRWRAAPLLLLNAINPIARGFASASPICCISRNDSLAGRSRSKRTTYCTLLRQVLWLIPPPAFDAFHSAYTHTHVCMCVRERERESERERERARARARQLTYIDTGFGSFQQFIQLYRRGRKRLQYEWRFDLGSKCAWNQ
jgi:hypothetical protein